MLVKPMMFAGNCAGCGVYSDETRGAVEVGVDEDSDGIGQYMCLKCALKLAKRILKARKKCQENMGNGMVFRFDKWQPAPTEKRGSEAT